MSVSVFFWILRIQRAMITIHRVKYAKRNNENQQLTDLFSLLKSPQILFMTLFSMTITIVYKRETVKSEMTVKYSLIFLFNHHVLKSAVKYVSPKTIINLSPIFSCLLIDRSLISPNINFRLKVSLCIVKTSVSSTHIYAYKALKFE